MTTPKAECENLMNSALPFAEQMLQKYGEFQATALVYDTMVILPSTGKRSDAIAVSLNHRENYSVTVFFPYQLSSGQLSFGDVFAQKGKTDVFPTK